MASYLADRTLSAISRCCVLRVDPSQARVFLRGFSSRASFSLSRDEPMAASVIVADDSGPPPKNSSANDEREIIPGTGSLTYL